MKKDDNILRVPELTLPAQELSFDCIDHIMTLAEIEEHPIACNNWADGEVDINARFSIAHDQNNIIVRYRIREESIRALYIDDNECRPFEDSCVELFITSDETRTTYHNIESNCIGALQFKSGTADKLTRHRHPQEITSQIGRYTTLPQKAIEAQCGSFEWSLIMVVPAHLIGFEKGVKLSAQQASANFYKCGDKLPQPHYLSWKPIESANPNFHLPQFFGDIIFE